jgi:hypothetical protein
MIPPCGAGQANAKPDKAFDTKDDLRYDYMVKNFYSGASRGAENSLRRGLYPKGDLLS